MKILNYLLAVYWFVLLVLTATGFYQPNTFSIVVTMFITSVYFVQSAKVYE